MRGHSDDLDPRDRHSRLLTGQKLRRPVSRDVSSYGNTLGALGEGTWEQFPGESKWKVTLDAEGSNGDRVRSVGVIDLANRSWDGEMFQI